MILHLLELGLGVSARAIAGAWDACTNVKRLRQALGDANKRIVQLQAQVEYLERVSEEQRQVNLVLARRETLRIVERKAREGER